MEIFGIGWSEMLVIAIVALIVVGPERLPEVARLIGRGIRGVVRSIRELEREVRRPLDEINDTKPPHA
ncbi:MAG: twin-arginine translocase subunit TatB [Zetaproteobacteria bacterium]|nr:MAG: twin-arginine translocase subunit TatB [Zetaproteobacteria bacterium]